MLLTHALFPHLFPAGSYSTSVNWVIKYFYIRACAGGDSHINTVITGQTFCFEGQACRTDFCLPLKYFITSKWKILYPIQTYLQVILRGFRCNVYNISRVDSFPLFLIMFTSLCLFVLLHNPWNRDLISHFNASNRWDHIRDTLVKVYWIYTEWTCFD